MAKGQYRSNLIKKVEQVEYGVSDTMDAIENAVAGVRDALKDARSLSSLEAALEVIEDAYQTLDTLADKLY